MRGQEPGSEHERRDDDGSAAPATPPPSFGQLVEPVIGNDGGSAEPPRPIPVYPGPPPDLPDLPVFPGAQAWEVTGGDAAPYDWFSESGQPDWQPPQPSPASTGGSNGGPDGGSDGPPPSDGSPADHLGRPLDDAYGEQSYADLPPANGWEPSAESWQSPGTEAPSGWSVVPGAPPWEPPPAFTAAAADMNVWPAPTPDAVMPPWPAATGELSPEDDPAPSPHDAHDAHDILAPSPRRESAPFDANSTLPDAHAAEPGDVPVWPLHLTPEDQDRIPDLPFAPEVWSKKPPKPTTSPAAQDEPATASYTGAPGETPSAEATTAGEATTPAHTTFPGEATAPGEVTTPAHAPFPGEATTPAHTAFPGEATIPAHTTVTSEVTRPARFMPQGGEPHLGVNDQVGAPAQADTDAPTGPTGKAPIHADPTTGPTAPPQTGAAPTQTTPASGQTAEQTTPAPGQTIPGEAISAPGQANPMPGTQTIPGEAPGQATPMPGTPSSDQTTPMRGSGGPTPSQGTPTPGEGIPMPGHGAIAPGQAAGDAAAPGEAATPPGATPTLPAIPGQLAQAGPGQAPPVTSAHPAQAGPGQAPPPAPSQALPAVPAQPGQAGLGQTGPGQTGPGQPSPIGSGQPLPAVPGQNLPAVPAQGSGGRPFAPFGPVDGPTPPNGAPAFQPEQGFVVPTAATKQQGKSKKALFAVLGVLVLAGVATGGFFAYRSMKSAPPTKQAAASAQPSAEQPTAEPPTTAQPTVTPSADAAGTMLNSDKTDPKKLSLTEAFPQKKLSLAGASFMRVKTDMQNSCDKAATGPFADALKAQKCTRVLRATYVDTKHLYAVTTGIAVLPTKDAALQADQAKNLSKNLWFTALPGAAGSGADRVGIAGGYAAGLVWGRYIVFSYATYADGHTPTPKEKTLGKVSGAFRDQTSKVLEHRLTRK